VLGHLKTLGRLLNGGSPSYGAGAVGGTLARSLTPLFLTLPIFKSSKAISSSNFLCQAKS
jgi:hypothetical protein